MMKLIILMVTLNETGYSLICDGAGYLLFCEGTGRRSNQPGEGSSSGNVVERTDDTEARPQVGERGVGGDR